MPGAGAGGDAPGWLRAAVVDQATPGAAVRFVGFARRDYQACGTLRRGAGTVVALSRRRACAGCCNSACGALVIRLAFPRWRACSRAPASRPPCVLGAAQHVALPSAVCAPVLPPPCIRHRPLGIAGPWQGWPVRLHLAPHRRAALARSSSTRHRGASPDVQASPCAPVCVMSRRPSLACL